jgi:peroxiredoxin
MRASPASLASVAALLVLYGGTKVALYRPPLATGQSVLTEGGQAPGKEAELVKALQGKRIWVINFFETWCGPCKVELPVVQRLYDEHSTQGLGVVGVYGNSSVGDIEAFRSRMGLSFPLVHDDRGELARKYAVEGVPSTFITDGTGRLLHQLRGLDTDLADKVNGAMDSSGPVP